MSDNGIDRTTLFLEFNGQQPDMEAMLKHFDKSWIKTNDSTQETNDSIQENNDSTQETNNSTQETHDSTQETNDSTQENSTTNREKVILLLSENSKMTLSEVAHKVGLTRNGVKKIVEKLRHEGILSRKGSTKSGYWIVNR